MEVKTPAAGYLSQASDLFEKGHGLIEEGKILFRKAIRRLNTAMDEVLDVR